MDDEEYDSEDDNIIFVGEITLEEMKKRLLSGAGYLPEHLHKSRQNKRRQTIEYTNVTCNKDADDSIKIIEVHSAPNMLKSNSYLPTSPISGPTSMSQLYPEAMLDYHSKQKTKVEFNNYKDDHSKITETLLTSSSSKPHSTTPTSNLILQGASHNITKRSISSPKLSSEMYLKSLEVVLDLDNDSKLCSLESGLNSTIPPETNSICEHNVLSQSENVTTPKTEKEFITRKPDTPVSPLTPPELYKTPPNFVLIKKGLFGNHMSNKEQQSTLSRKYQSIVSPVATYIRNSSQVPLFRDICPKQPLPKTTSIPRLQKQIGQQKHNSTPSVSRLQTQTGQQTHNSTSSVPGLQKQSGQQTHNSTSSVPRLQKQTGQQTHNSTSSVPRFQNQMAVQQKNNNKENQEMRQPTSSIPRLKKTVVGNQVMMNIPKVAYRPAKETKMINQSIVEEKKLPKNEWARKIASAIPRATVIKHGHREVHSMENLLQKHQQDNSFANLPLQQADLSVCTQKTVFSKPRKA